MKCPTCKSEIEVIDRYEKDEGYKDDSYHEPCAKCENRETDVDEMPCAFCSWEVKRYCPDILPENLVPRN